MLSLLLDNLSQTSVGGRVYSLYRPIQGWGGSAQKGYLFQASCILFKARDITCWGIWKCRDIYHLVLCKIIKKGAEEMIYYLKFCSVNTSSGNVWCSSVVLLIDVIPRSSERDATLLSRYVKGVASLSKWSAKGYSTKHYRVPPLAPQSQTSALLTR